MATWPPCRRADHVTADAGSAMAWLLRRLFGLVLGADRLSRTGRPDAERPGGSNRCSLGLGVRSEERAAAGRQLRLVSDHAGGDPVDVRDLGAAKPERIAAAGLLLLRGIGPAGDRPDRSRQCGGQHPPA